MKKKWVIFVFIILCMGIVIVFSLPEKKEELEVTVDLYSDHKLSDFKDQVTCEILEDQEIITDKVEDQEISSKCKFKYIKGKLNVKVHVIDSLKPVLMLGDTMTVTEGYDKKLEEVIVSIDNYDQDPKREIIGEYDLNKVGTYPLHYKITDASGNINEKDFTLNVVPKKNSNGQTTSIQFEDVLKNYKTDQNEIGIDVSKWQGVIDFEKVKNAGAKFVMIRLGYQNGYGGDYTIDPYFKQNIENAKKQGLKVGVYFYTYAHSKKEAKKEAKWVLENIKNYTLDLPIAYDWENWSTLITLKLNLVEFNDIMKTFIDEIQKNNYEAMLYSSKNYLENIWDTNVSSVWLAHYINKTTYEGKYKIWQLCENGRIDGIKGNVDIDILYLDV